MDCATPVEAFTVLPEKGYNPPLITSQLAVPHAKRAFGGSARHHLRPFMQGGRESTAAPAR
jgi:hypothetical protein